MKPSIQLAVFAFLFVSLLTACDEPDLSINVESGDIPFRPTGDVMHLMEWVLEPAADRIWDSAGFVITAEGTQDLQPTTDAGWAEVQHSAMVVAEAGNLLLMPGIAKDSADWREISLGLIDAGLKAKAAAEVRDAEALFEAGGHLYRVCLSCHSMYDKDDEIARDSN